MKKIAVILCGSGYLDGSEIRESVGVLWALSTAKADVSIFAPDEAQFDVMNCLTGEPVSGEKRNQLVEAARIARGKVEPLSKLRPEAFDGIILPGGYGAAKNLCSFASAGSAGKVHPQLLSALKAFHSAKKPIGAVCIAPAIVALAFPQGGFELTVGEKGEAAGELEKLGHKTTVKKANEWCTDRKNRIVTTPAYMHDGAALHEIFQGIQGLVNDVISLVG